ncbi:hypothetical protein [Syntrophus sp. (in: bacteria)]|uniref:hypothetical protein n=1 Tax=Syntrophus sp. (in: bacteria) TaxID=48412 RepID=UPI00345E1B67
MFFFPHEFIVFIAFELQDAAIGVPDVDLFEMSPSEKSGIRCSQSRDNAAGWILRALDVSGCGLLSRPFNDEGRRMAEAARAADHPSAAGRGS